MRTHLAHGWESTKTPQPGSICLSGCHPRTGDLLFAFVFLVVIPEGDLLLAFVFLVVIPEGDLLLAFVFLVVIPEGDLLFAFVFLVVIPEGDLLLAFKARPQQGNPDMSIQIDLTSVKITKPHEYAIRFLFGGLVTATTGLIAIKYGPSIAGLFLAFPAIFPATATLIAKHEKERKRKAGYNDLRRGRAMASVDAAGTSLGALALGVFALIVWRLLPDHSSIAILTVAAITWMILSILLWQLRRRL